jgi:hypothetical protein
MGKFGPMFVLMLGFDFMSCKHKIGDDCGRQFTDHLGISCL